MELKRYYIYRGFDKRIIGIKEYTHWYVPIREFDYIQLLILLFSKNFLN
jgi:hypothetical protein